MARRAASSERSPPSISATMSPGNSASLIRTAAPCGSPSAISKARNAAARSTMPPAPSIAPVRICGPIGVGRRNDTSFMVRRLRDHRLVQLTLPLFQQGDDDPFDDLLEVWGVAMGVERRLIGIVLVEQEDVGIVCRSISVVELATGFVGADERRHPPQQALDFVALPGLRKVLRCQNDHSILQVVNVPPGSPRSAAS